MWLHGVKGVRRRPCGYVCTACIELHAATLICREQGLGVDLPLSYQCAGGAGRAGEVLGCTAPVVAGGADAIVFVADGRFHLEAIMIANPDIPAFRCHPALCSAIATAHGNTGKPSSGQDCVQIGLLG